MKATITFEIDTDSGLESFTDRYIAALWHIAQANPADPMRDQASGELAEIIGREIIRRFVTNTPPELWNHQGRHYDWAARHLKKETESDAGEAVPSGWTPAGNLVPAVKLSA